MSTLKIIQMGGVRPAQLARALPEGDAQVAQNLLARTSEFRPLADDVDVATVPVANPQSLYRFARKADGTLNVDMALGWRASAHALNHARGQIDDSTTDRVYYTRADGSEPPRVMDATGADRPLGVPASSAAPLVTVQEVYSFTEEQKRIEKFQATERAVQLVEGHASLAVVGIASLLPSVGWLRESDFNAAPEVERNVLRVFALDPTTKKIIATYSDMPPEEAAWIFDPALGGYYSPRPAGVTLPAWCAGHSLWWVVSLKAFARAYTLNAANLSAALQQLDMPGTQGAQKYLTAPEADTVTARMVAKFDVNAPATRSLLVTLLEQQQRAANLFNRGGAVSLDKAVQDFYARADIAASIEAAEKTFAEAIWRYAEMIGTASAKPWYQDDTGA